MTVFGWYEHAGMSETTVCHIWLREDFWLPLCGREMADANFDTGEQWRVESMKFESLADLVNSDVTCRECATELVAELNLELMWGRGIRPHD